MYVMADGLTRLLAPILSFTADELWGFLPGPREASVHMALFPTGADVAALADPDLVERWNRLTAIRDQVLGAIEPLRKDKQIGSSLQAKVLLTATPDDFALLKRYEKQLPMLFIVSQVEVSAGTGAAAEDGKPGITIGRAAGVKCERCWRYVPAVSADPAWLGLCERCQDALQSTSLNVT